ncbi:MAG: peptidyl-prolyl cis-trans isomerase [Acidobacteria bacterium]|nr:peptidyl-prolyl cis-trans isomerase [Acidobacteriota bacterium]
MSKLQVLVLGAAFAVLPFVAQAQTAPPQPPAQPPAQAPQVPATPAVAPALPSMLLEQILVKVNGDIITKTDLEARQIDELRRRGQPLNDDQLKKAIAELTPDILVAAVDELLLMQRGKELGYKVTEDQYKRVLDNIRKENKLESDEAFGAALKQEGLDMSVLRKNLERQLIINQVQQVEVMGKLGLTEEEARRYYDEHKSDFTTPAAITLRELVVNVPTDGKNVNVARDEETKRKAEGVLARLKAGEAFEKLVAELSDSPSKANGGLVGPIQPEELAPDIKKLVDPLKPGQTTAVYRTPKGYGILKLETATKADVKPFEQAREEVGNKVYDAKRRAEFDKYIRRLRSEGIIEWKNEEMQKLWIAKTSAPPTEPKNPGV